jgi:CRISPR-associated protein Cpf1
MSLLNQFANLYPVTKTLSMGLLPVNETAKYIDDYGSDKLRNAINADIKIQKDSKLIQGFLDNRMKLAITDILSGDAPDGLDSVIDKMMILRRGIIDKNKSLDERKALKVEHDELQVTARELVAAHVGPLATLLSPAPALKSLPKWMAENDYSAVDIELAKTFKSGATGYFVKYFKAREMLLVSDDKHNTLAHRIINTNLYRYVSNLIIHQDIYKQGGLVSEISDMAEKLNKLLSLSFSDLLTHDGIENYNRLLQGVVDTDRSVDKGLNILIREFRAKTKMPAKETPLFEKLDALPLFGDKKVFGNPSELNDKDVLTALSDECKVLTNEKIPRLEQAVKNIIKSDHDGIYVMPQYIKSLSSSIFGSYDLISGAIKLAGLDVKSPISLGQIDHAIIDYHVSLDESDEHHDILANRLLNNKPVLTYFSAAIMGLTDDFHTATKKAKKVLGQNEIIGSRRPPKTLDENDKGGKGFFQLQKIQNILKSLQAIVSHYRPLLPLMSRKPVELLEPDAAFYEDFMPIMQDIDQVYFECERMARTHFTKKPGKGSKVRLSFDNGYFMSGWALSTVSTSGAVILEREGKYYLTIAAGKRSVFDLSLSFDDYQSGKVSPVKEARIKAAKSCSPDAYKLLVYNQITNFSMAAPRIFLWTEKRRDFFKPSEEILKIANTSSFTKNGKPKPGFDKADFNLGDCHKMIDYFKSCIDKHPVWNQFDFKFSPTTEYQSIDGFYNEVNAQSYKLSHMGIDPKYIENLLKDESIFMFQIYCQDFSPAAKGTPNLFTQYFLATLDTENPNNCYKLNGGAEMFFKKHKIKPGKEVVHPKNEPLKAKTPGAQSPTRTLPYDIIKDKKATKDTFSLNFSITANYSHQTITTKQHNELIDGALLDEADNASVLAIHRGERNLLSYSVVKRNGLVVEQGNLNTIYNPGTGVGTNYRNLLSEKQQKYRMAQRNWGIADNMKGLKSGYLSHALPVIVNLAIKHNAYICIEDLNGKFVDRRKAIDANVYQTFDAKLASKLNYLVVKSKEDNEPAGINRALQLAQPSGVDGYFKSGIILKVSPSYTSKTCPRTGFVNLLDFRYKNMSQARSLLQMFSCIYYDEVSDLFCFDFDYRDFKLNTGFTLENYQSTWSVSTHGDKRYYYDRVEKRSVEFNATESLKNLLSDFGIAYRHNINLIDAFCRVSKADFYKQLFVFMSSIFSIKQYQAGTDYSFAISPIMVDGEYYCSLDPKDNEPGDIDALNCYVLAKKAWWSLNKLSNGAKKIPYVNNDKYFNNVLVDG